MEELQQTRNKNYKSQLAVSNGNTDVLSLVQPGMKSEKNIFGCESFSVDYEVHDIKKQNQNLKRSCSFDAQNQFHLKYSMPC